MEKTERKYWFPAKTYGWGWGMPATWQGWGVLLTYLLSIGSLVWLVDPDKHFVGFVLLGGLLTAIFMTVCYVKGEPPRWRWGK